MQAGSVFNGVSINIQIVDDVTFQGQITLNYFLGLQLLIFSIVLVTCFDSRVNKVSLCNDHPASVIRTCGRPSGRPDVRTSVRPENLNVDIFSETMITRVMKLGTTVLCGKALQNLRFSVTFTQGHSHRG